VSVAKLPLEERKAQLERLVGDDDPKVKYTLYSRATGRAFSSTLVAWALRASSLSVVGTATVAAAAKDG
jgi:hypothetical protein